MLTERGVYWVSDLNQVCYTREDGHFEKLGEPHPTRRMAHAMMRALWDYGDLD